MSSDGLQPMDALIAELAELVPPSSVDAHESGVRVVVSEVELDLPIETRIAAEGLTASMPRGRLRTGFSMPHGRLRMRLIASAAADPQPGRPA